MRRVSKQKVFIGDLLFVNHFKFSGDIPHLKLDQIRAHSANLLHNFEVSNGFCSVYGCIVTEAIVKRARFIDFIKTNVQVGCSYAGL